jgi:hypothetical protein
MLIKPSHSLNKGLLFSIFFMLLGHITSDREAVNDTAVKIDLVWLLGLHEDDFGLVTFLGGEDLVCFCGRDGQGP